MENEHDQLIRLKERLLIYRDWINLQFVHSDVDEYQAWEELKNDVLSKCQNRFCKLFEIPLTKEQTFEAKPSSQKEA